MKGQLFMVAAVLNPKKKDAEEGVMSKMVLEPTPIIARDDRDAAIKTVIGNKKLEKVDKNLLEVIIRPF